MKDYADLEKRLRAEGIREMDEAAAAISELTKRCEVAESRQRTIQSAYWRIVKSERDRATQAAIFTQQALDDAIVAGYDKHLPSLEEVQRSGPYVRVGFDETLEEASQRQLPRDPLADDPADGDQRAPGDAVKRGFD